MATNFDKNNPKLQNFNSVQEIKDFFACIVGFTAFVNSNMLPKISNLDKNDPKLHKFQFCTKKLKKISPCMGLQGLVNSNTLPEFFREPRELNMVTKFRHK